MKLPLAAGVLLALVATLLTLSAAAAEPVLRTFKRIQFADQFWCEGASFADFNKDGKKTSLAGPWWWEGPDFKKSGARFICTQHVSN